MLLTPDTVQLSQIISHAAALAFPLGAVAGFTSILHGRLVSALTMSAFFDPALTPTAIA
jgi:hypothetical protein